MFSGSWEWFLRGVEEGKEGHGEGWEKGGVNRIMIPCCVDKDACGTVNTARTGGGCMHGAGEKEFQTSGS